MKQLFVCFILIATVSLGFDAAQAQTQIAQRRPVAEFQFTNLLQPSRAPQRRAGFSLMPANHNVNLSAAAFTLAGPNLPVIGGGTIGRLTKWTGFTSGNSVVGNSTIFEDKFGMVGIGTDAPTSRLTVLGMIESKGAGGGLKFPDGTVQTTAALASTIHDATLMGDGTTSSPLGIAVPLSLSGAVFGPVLTVQNTQEEGGGQGATIIAGPGAVALGAFGGSAAPGTSGSGWGIDARGGQDSNPSGEGGIGVRALGGSSPGTGGPGVSASGGSGPGSQAGPGVRAFGGTSTGPGGIPGAGVEAEGGTGGINGALGVKATGGNGNNQGGPGVEATGGPGNIGKGGDGLTGIGGTSVSSIGGNGVVARGGQSSDETGGHGVRASGGDSDTEIGGHGIIASGGSGPMGNGLAGKFDGDVEITGNLNVTGATKNFKIDHPLDPENKYLYHAAIESSEALNLYSGNAKLDTNGEAIVLLPEWFQAINRDFRYSLTPIGAPASRLYIAQELAGNRFKIAGGLPGMKVSWQVTGVRSDRVMLKNPFKVEEEKSERERGTYLHPEAFGQPEERSVEWARYPELMKQRKAARKQGIAKPR